MRAVLFIAFLCVCSSLCVDRSKFRTCEQTGFCKRNRQLQANPPSASYAVLPNSVSLAEQEGRFDAIVADGRSGDLLTLRIQTLENGVFRFTLKEKEPLFPRFLATDALDGEPRKVGFTTKKSTADEVVIAFAQNREIVVKFNPLFVNFLVEGKSVLQANRRGLLNYEVSRKKPEAVDPAVSDNNGEWEETFGSHRDSKPRGPQSVGLDFTFVGSDYLYGIPEHASQLTLKPTMGKGDPYRLFNLDVFEYELDSEMALYGAIPFMIGHDTTKTTGLFWLNAAETWVDISERNSAPVLPFWSSEVSGYDTHWISGAGNIDVFLFSAEHPYKVIEQYTDLTGKTAMPQLFSVAYHQCRWNYRDQEDVATVNSKFDEYELPMDVIWLDIEHTNGKRYFTWDQRNFPNPQEMLAGVSSKGRKMVTIVDPHLKIDQSYSVYKQALDKGLLTRKSDGSNYDGWCWSGSSGYLDFVNPEARRFWAEMYSFQNYLGSNENLYIWNDMNEPSVFNGPEVSMGLDNLHFSDSEHREIHNMYGFYVHMASFDGLVQRHADKNDRPFVLSRAFFAGSQRYGAIWTGDNAARWDHLKVTVPMLTSLGLAGMANSGADVGGFFGNPDPELLARWYQAGAYQPFFRGHAHIDAKRREPYLFDEPYLSQMRNALRERYALLPYIYTLFYDAHRSGIPVMRPMWTEFPKDASLFTVDDQFMLGASLLVKPISSPGATSTQVILPAGIWYPITGTQQYLVVKGEQTVTVPVTGDFIPVYQRGGSIIPRKDRPRRSSKAMEHDPYTLYVAPDSNGYASGTLYVDDGKSFNYKNGDFLHREFVLQGNKLVNSEKTPSKRSSPSPLVERIVIYGIESAPSTITLHTPTQPQQILESDYDLNARKLVIRKPAVEIGASWEIRFD
eukprot:TRINITY_DN287_c0_g2_i1.p1 TRINITY_DN287_c0_g2~~TRINITY_DN287_c0_g2_i1.p1  ORF type:complete len:902 (+),score=170.73 TRINITY_DN287_c0_g2_i1:48-2753(+)